LLTKGNIMANGKSIGVAYADPQFESLIVTGDTELQGGISLTGGNLDITTTSDSTSGSVSVEPVSVSTTMTGAGGVGGRAKFLTTVNSALGSFSNALKGEVTYGASGSTTGLGSAIVAEMSLSAGTSAGTYAPVEIELNLPANAVTGTATSLIYASVNGADKTTFDDNGSVMNLAGVTAGAGKAVASPGGTFAATATGTALGGADARGLKVLIGGAEFYLLAIPAATYEA
jgi:hypothetical protein